jgi:hypothetical protein
MTSNDEGAAGRDRLASAGVDSEVADTSDQRASTGAENQSGFSCHMSPTGDGYSIEKTARGTRPLAYFGRITPAPGTM